MLVVMDRERQAVSKNLRQKEKKLKDLTAQMEDERKQAQEYKDQVTEDDVSVTTATSQCRGSGFHT